VSSLIIRQGRSQARRYTAVIPVLGRLRQENYKFKASLGYIVRP
jgi:hypothetical protein